MKRPDDEGVDAITHPEAETAAVHALGLLGAEEALAFQVHLRICARCRDEAAGHGEVLGALVDAVPRITPSPGLRGRLLEGAAAPPPAAHPHPPDFGENAGISTILTDKASIQRWKNWTGADRSRDGLTWVPAGSGTWEATAVDGVEVRKLFVDPPRDRVTMLIRMLAGASYPAHRHGGPEECYVLKGDLHAGPGIHMRTGDYLMAEAGCVHGVQSTDGGCLLMIVSSLRDELLETHS